MLEWNQIASRMASLMINTTTKKDD